MIILPNRIARGNLVPLEVLGYKYRFKQAKATFRRKYITQGIGHQFWVMKNDHGESYVSVEEMPFWAWRKNV